MEHLLCHASVIIRKQNGPDDALLKYIRSKVTWKRRTQHCSCAADSTSRRLPAARACAGGVSCAGTCPAGSAHAAALVLVTRPRVCIRCPDLGSRPRAGATWWTLLRRGRHSLRDAGSGLCPPHSEAGASLGRATRQTDVERGTN